MKLALRLATRDAVYVRALSMNGANVRAPAACDSACVCHDAICVVCSDVPTARVPRSHAAGISHALFHGFLLSMSSSNRRRDGFRSSDDFVHSSNVTNRSAEIWSRVM